MAEHTTTPPSSDVYYAANYWNARPEVIAHLHRRATGDERTDWWRHLLAWRGRPFERILAINCGNGWVERDLVQQGVAAAAVGVDISEELLAAARDAASAAGLPLEYRAADINTFAFDVPGVDCVVNYAAGHHVAHIDAVFRRIAGLLGPDGVFVSWDYTGPHRNQYTATQWEAMHELNESLPPHLRKRLVYPHLPTMLVSDPTEAIHSELVLPVIRRYFDIHHLRHLGGGLAYELLTFNDAFFDPGLDTSAEVRRILEADEAFTDADPEHRSLFTYVVATPRAEPPDPADLERWSTEERERERQAAEHGGRYGRGTLLGELTERLERVEREHAALLGAGPPRPGRGERLGATADHVARRVAASVRARTERARAPRH